MSVTFLTDKDLDNLILRSGTLIESTVNNSIISINDAANRPAILAVSKIKASQPGAGNPSSDNVRPVSGWNVASLTQTKKNLLGFADYTHTGSAYTDTCASGIFRREVSTYHTTTYVITTTGIGYLIHRYLPAGTYTFMLTYTTTSGATFSNPYLEVTLSDGTVAKLSNGVTTSIALGGTITGVRTSSKGFSVGTIIEYTMQLEAGNGTSYEPYSGATITADLPETVYGGSLDWTNGVLTVTHKNVLLTGTGTAWTYGSSNIATRVNDRAANSTLCSDRYITNSSNGPTGLAIGEMCLGLNYNNVCFGNPGNALTIDEWRTQCDASPIQLVYELANPTTIILTPQQLNMLKGENTIWSDTGDTFVTYPVDTKLYIDNKFGALQNAILASGANI